MGNHPAAGLQAYDAGAGRIIGIGVDLCAIERMQRALADSGNDLIGTLFRPAEIACCRKKSNPAAVFAACFAAKEAVLKSLARLEGRGAFWQDIEIQAAGGIPQALLHGRLAAMAAGELDGPRVSRVLVAASWCRHYATATAVALG